MPTAATRFFNLPELVYAMAEFLDTTDVLSLVRTSRTIIAVCHPLLFRFLDLANDARYCRLILSSTARQGLANNTHVGRTLRVTQLEVAYLYSCLLPYQDSIPATDDSQINRPSWLSLPDLIGFPVVPLSPMCKVVELYIKADTIVAGLSSLEELDLVVIAEHGLLVPEFKECSNFFIRPPSIRKFLVELKYHYVLGNALPSDSDETDRYQGAEEQALTNLWRKDFLNNLIELMLPFMEDDLGLFTTTEFQQVLDHCPEVRTLIVAFILPETPESWLDTMVAKSCPKLRALTYILDSAVPLTFPFKLMENMAENQTEACKEVLKFSRQSEWSMAHIRIDDAVTTIPWRCTGLQHLELIISGTSLLPCYPFNLEPDNQYRGRHFATTRAKLEQLERLHQQIGSLTELNYIHLCTVSIVLSRVWATAASPFQQNTFPAMLNLSGGAGGSGLPGYLNLLGGLSKLKML
ncbi:hypothetical protein BGW39_008977, partial [Mortierella sp. 14UC]